MAAFAEAQREDRAELERACGGFRLTPPAEQAERLLERLGCLARASDLENRFGPADEQVRSLEVVRRREFECPSQARLGLRGVESERALAREREEAPRR